MPDVVGMMETQEIWKGESNELACHFEQCVFREGVCVCVCRGLIKNQVTIATSAQSLLFSSTALIKSLHLKFPVTGICLPPGSLQIILRNYALAPQSCFPWKHYVLLSLCLCHFLWGITPLPHQEILFICAQPLCSQYLHIPIAPGLYITLYWHCLCVGDISL